ncbi:hypothetical protein [Williamsia sp. R60]
MTRLDQLRLFARERRAATEQFLLGRALRTDPTIINRIITRVVLTRIPQFPAEKGRTRKVDDAARGG